MERQDYGLSVDTSYSEFEAPRDSSGMKMGGVRVENVSNFPLNLFSDSIFSLHNAAKGSYFASKCSQFIAKYYASLSMLYL